MNMDKLELYNKAKDGYYNGETIMTDMEFDELEKELGLENKGYIGSKSSPKYTEEHPVIMGSLSKVQIHEKNGFIDWQTYLNEINNYILKYYSTVETICTPKYDGCSFEVYVKNKKLVSISSRGDGKYGVNLKHIIYNKLPKNFESNSIYDTFILRGEILINKNVFIKKYSDFVNPRSFVSSVVTSDYSDDKDYLDKVNDLSIVIYDYKIFDGFWIDKDFTNLPNIYNNLVPQMYLNITFSENINIKNIYNEFSEYRKTCECALDGFVIKPNEKYRNYSTEDVRPKDCVAVKFIPQLNVTKVEKIEWNVSKNYELIPTIYVEPVTMDGKIIRKCSGYNYGYIIDNKISKGVEVILSLAGDIIPFLYKVTNNDNFNINNIDLNNQYIYIDGCHLYVNLSKKDKAKLDFIASAETLSIPGIGPAIAESIFEYVVSNNVDDETNEFFGIESSFEYPTNILQINPTDIYIGAGQKKIGTNTKNNFQKFIKTLTLSDVIKSCNFKFCGEAVSKQIENYLFEKEYSFAHLANEGYAWVLNESSENYNKLNKILDILSMTIEDFKKDQEYQYNNDNTNKEKIYVILTGEPNNYSSKAEFLQYHPEYELTTSWKKVNIVFTNSIESNTGKMKKAREKNIEIKLY